MHASVRGHWLTFNGPLEGRVNFMYLDVKGYLSTGVGNKIDETVAELSPPSPAEREASLRLANQFEWTKPDGSIASSDEIAAAWDAVKSRLDLAELGHKAFQDLSDLRLTNDEIDRMVFVKLDEMESFLRGRPEFADIDSWPADAQLAVLSMSWAMGPAFNFPNFQGFVAARKWAEAADESHFTPDVGTIRVRNKLDHECLRKAQVVEDNALPFEQLAVETSTVFGVQGALITLGFDPGIQDGGDGPRTQGAVRAFEEANGLAPTGAFDDPTFVATLDQRLVERGFQLVTL